MSFDRLGMLDKALSDHDRLLRLQPRYSDAFVSRAQIRQKNGDRAGALADFRASLRHAPADWTLRAAVEKKIRALTGKP